MPMTAKVRRSRNIKNKKTSSGESYVCQDRGNGHRLRNGGLDWMLGNFFFYWKDVQTLEQTAHRSGGITISESGQAVYSALEDMG